MRFLNDLSIRTKMLVMLTAVVSLALAIEFGVSISGDIRRIKAAMTEHHSILADVLGANCNAALNFKSAHSARGVLSSLQLEPAITFACIYDAQGKVFTDDDGVSAIYQTDLQFNAPPLSMHGTSFNADGHLEVFNQIIQEGKILGTVYLRVNMERLNLQIRNNLTVAGSTLTVALIVSLALGWRLERLMTQPIYALAQITKTIAQQADYSLHVRKQSNDELGQLCDSFNAMLKQIQIRDAELEQHHHNLEDLVQERTHNLNAKTQELSVVNLALHAEVAERTRVAQKLRETAAELARSNTELEDFNQLMIGRELRIIEMKTRINELAKELGRQAPYDLAFAAETGMVQDRAILGSDRS